MKVDRYTLLTLDVSSKDMSIEISSLHKQFASNPQFFKGAGLVLRFLFYPSVDEIKSLISRIEIIGVSVVGISGKVDVKESVLSCKPIVEKSSQDGTGLDALLVAERNSDTHIFYSDVGSGESVESTGRDLVIVGNVSHGAVLKAKGNIVVVGRLEGVAMAGLKGDINSSIVSLEMNAQKVTIADVSALGYQIGVRKSRSRIILSSGVLIYDN